MFQFHRYNESMKILVVEDEHRIAQALKKGLEQEHYTVDIAFEGFEGYDLALSENYDLLILDLMLPGKDGLSICKELRNQDIHTPILILTAKDQVNDKVLGLNTGADDYLSKPFSFSELLARVKALLRRPRQSVSKVLKIDDLVLNPQEFSVARGGKTLQLSSTEFSLLEYLLKQSRKIVTKDQIINHVWNYDTDILPNTVEVYIRNLRKKIEAPFPDKPRLIYTFRGFGYKLGE